MTAGLLTKVDRQQALNAGVAAIMLIRARQRAEAPHPRPDLMPHQRVPEGEWSVFLMIGGRGAGKTEAGARATDDHARGPRCLEGPVPHRMAIIAPSHDDAVDTCVRGESGLLQQNRTIRFAPGAALAADLTWPNGAEAELFGAFAPEDVERLRGPQHCFAWGDEFAAWRKLDETWDIAAFGMRLGPHPRWVLTTTPKRRELLKRLMADPATIVSHARTSDNPFLPEQTRKDLYARYGGTSLGRQELDAELIEDQAGALWRRMLIDPYRVQVAPVMSRVVVAIDPSATSAVSSDEAGILVVGLGMDGHGYVLGDYSLRASPAIWAIQAIDAFDGHKADRIVAETNNGGEMVEAVLRNIRGSIPYTAVTASRGKQTRAEPVSALYEQGRVHHVGPFALLEDQMCSWVPGEKSPDRMDALVWGLTELMVTSNNPWAGLTNASGVA